MNNTINIAIFASHIYSIKRGRKLATKMGTAFNPELSSFFTSINRKKETFDQQEQNIQFGIENCCQFFNTTVAFLFRGHALDSWEGIVWLPFLLGLLLIKTKLWNRSHVWPYRIFVPF